LTRGFGGGEGSDLEGAGPIRSEAGADSVPVGPVPSISLGAEGETWAVSEAGGGRSGTGSDVGASLLLVRFTSSAADRPAREVLVAASSLEALGGDDIREAFERAKPRRPPVRKPVGTEAANDDVPVSE
jgi:hypothetical protein